MKKFISILMIMMLAVMVSISFTSCEDEASTVRYNLAREADNFNCQRRITVINCITGDTLLTVEGRCSITADRGDNQLEILVEYEQGQYKKNIIGLSDNVAYLVEDLDISDTDPYNYKVNVNPKMWWPYKLDVID